MVTPKDPQEARAEELTLRGPLAGAAVLSPLARPRFLCLIFGAHTPAQAERRGTSGLIECHWALKMVSLSCAFHSARACTIQDTSRALSNRA